MSCTQQLIYPRTKPDQLKSAWKSDRELNMSAGTGQRHGQIW